MAVKIIPKHASIEKDEFTEALEQSEIADKVDKYGVAVELLKAAEGKIKPLKIEVANLKADLDAHIDDHFGPLEKNTLDGEAYEYSFGKKSKVTQLKDKAKLRKFLGEEAFDALWTIGITPIRDYLSPPQLKQVLDEQNTGNRTTKVTKK